MKTQAKAPTLATLKFQNLKNARKAWIDYLNEFDWQWHASLSFGTTTSTGQAAKQLKRWIKDLKTEERLQLAGIALVNIARSENVHVHCLLISKETPFNARLSAVDKLKWARRWKGSACTISGACDPSLMGQGPAKFSAYFAKEKNLSLFEPDNYELIEIRPGLLSQLSNNLKPLSQQAADTIQAIENALNANVGTTEKQPWDLEE